MRKLIYTLKTCYFVFFFFLFFTIPVHAYLDPSVMTYAIQAVAGVAIALGTVAGFAWRKFRKKILHSDTNKYKEFESDALTFRDPEKNEAVTPDVVQIQAEQQRRVKKERITFKDKWHDFVRSFIPGILLSFAFSFMIAMYAPLEIYMNNKPEFWFDFSVLFPQMFKLSALIFLTAITILLFAYLLWEHFYHVLLIGGTVIFLCTYIQGNYLVANMPPMDGTTIDWSLYHKDMIVSGILWLAVFIGMILLARFVKIQRFRKFCSFLCAAISIMLLVSLFSINAKTNGTESKPYPHVISTNELFTMSSDQNFIIFILDAMDSKVSYSLMEKYPEYKKDFQDFVYYPDTIAAYPYTSRAVPFILNGQWYENQENFEAFQTKAMSVSPLLSKLEEQNYELTGYSTYIVDNSENLFRFSNIIKTEKKVSSSYRFMKLELKLSLYKYAPFFLKPLVAMDISEFSDTQYKPDDITKYSYQNPKFLNWMNNTKMETVSNKMFKLIHIKGGHVPFDMDKDLNSIDETKGTYEDKAGAALTIMSQYLNKLKEANVYDNSTIIILADHGFWKEKQNGTNRHNPLFMVKAAYEKHDSFTINETPLSYADLQDIYSRLLDGAEAGNISDYNESDIRTRRYLSYFPFTNTSHMKEMEYYGQAQEYDNCAYTGKEYIYDGR